LIVFIKVMVSPLRAVQVPRGSRGIAFRFINLGARWSRVVDDTTRCFTPGKDPRYPFYTNLGGPQDLWAGGEKRKSLLPTGFEPQTVHAVASRYSDCANTAPFISIVEVKVVCFHAMKAYIGVKV